MFENKSNYGIIQIEKRRLIMKILHLADLHLGKILQEQSFLEDQKYMLNKIIEKIIIIIPDIKFVSNFKIGVFSIISFITLLTGVINVLYSKSPVVIIMKKYELIENNAQRSEDIIFFFSFNFILKR